MISNEEEIEILRQKEGTSPSCVLWLESKRKCFRLSHS